MVSSPTIYGEKLYWTFYSSILFLEVEKECIIYSE